MNNILSSSINDVDLAMLLFNVRVWTIFEVDKLFVEDEEVKRIRLTIEDPFKFLIFWGVNCLSTREWKFISLTMAKAIMYD